MRSTCNSRAKLVLGAALVTAIAGCTDYAGPIPGTEQTTGSSTPQPGGGASSGNGNGSAGTQTPPDSSGGTQTPPDSSGGAQTPPDSSGGAQPPPQSSGMGNEALVSFDEDVHPILVEMCGMCHSEPGGGLPGHGAADADASFAAVHEMSNNEPVYERILARASGEDGYMPPGYAGCEGPLGSAGCLTQEQYDTIALWVQQGAMNR